MTTISERLCELIQLDALGARYFSVIDVGADRDGETAHVIVRPTSNDLIALIELATLCDRHSGHIVAHHQLRSTLGDFEADVRLGTTRLPKTFKLYFGESETPDSDHAI